MKEIVWIADFSVNEVRGGGEIVDAHLIDLLSQNGYNVLFAKASTLQPNQIKANLDKLYIVSNFVSLREEVKKILELADYYIVEHDHKYLRTRDPSPFPDLKAPLNQIINKSFYKKAKKVFCQSTKHGEVVRKNLGLTNIVSFGCTFWSNEEKEVLKEKIVKAKTGKVGVLESQNAVKGQLQAEIYCRNDQLDYELFSDPDYHKFIDKLAGYHKLVFFPQVFETFSRLAVEARILNCELVGNKNISAAYEPWFKLKGLDLLEAVNEHQASAEALFIDTIGELTQDNRQVADITVILNMYRRPSNMPMQVKAVKGQSVKPKQVWTWVNAHEDNENYDKEGLDVDRLFDNDHNWKFYGRFAAALLADTEYIAIFDDDTIPGERWFENCLETMKKNEGILGSAGVILNQKHYVDHLRCGWPISNPETTEVDLVGHAWFFKREWLQYLWKEKPPTWDNGEDIQFSFLAQKYGNIKTYCPPHPPEDRSLHGSILGNELGIDSKATSNNNETSHQQFFSERDGVVHNALENGWKTVKEVKL